jgi:pSer/pThr/pTyr-binding forkhead associated (FHA) protein
MAKLTLSFRDRKLKVFTLGPDETLIGREPDCAIVIDSLAVEPRHARICGDAGDYTISPFSAGTPLSVNDQTVTETHVLQEGDTIRIGKHTLHYSPESTAQPATAAASKTSSYGWLQILGGPHLGRSIRLDKAFTRIGKPSENLAVIARRDDGYYLSQLQGEHALLVNDTSIGDQSRKLVNGDSITVGSLQVQFFHDEIAGQASAPETSAPRHGEQRRFSRIPFDVAATLSGGGRTWETDLLDISLHGALIRMPQDFQHGAADQVYTLAVHLEGGPDICMDVIIAHREEDELGLDCHDIDLDSITHLRRLVELNLGDPELLERELSALG